MEVLSLPDQWYLLWGITNFVSLLEYQIQNTVFATLMFGIIYNQYKIKKMIKDLLSA